MRRKKILFCTEASHLPTGYSVYTKEVLSRLHQDPAFEVAELACYCDQASIDPNTPWKIYANQPVKGSAEWDDYKSYPSYQFGEYTFNQVLLDFLPDFVMDIRDWWMVEFQQRSTFRNHFHWALMPTVDAYPQNKQWIETFSTADSVFAYSEFGKRTLTNQCDSLNFIDIASPCASDSFSPVANKKAHRESMGIGGDPFIIGTVMRNQRRKLYPDLFKVFREFLDATKDPQCFLYCHTYYPDVGWEIPDLLQEYGLTNRVLFTYRCKKCGDVSPTFFSDSIQACKACNNFSKELVGVNNKIEEKDLARVYNLFDVYIQYANSEGFGMQQLEAVQSGLPLLAIDYSAMESVVKNVGAIPLKPLALTRECETGCHRAIPDNDATLIKLIELYSKDRESLRKMGTQMRENCLNHYSWDKTAKIWSDFFHRTPVKDISETWLSPPKIVEPAASVPEGLTPNDQANFLFEHVLHMPEAIGNYQWKRLVKDLTYKCSASSTIPGYYFNESHIDNNVQTWARFTVKEAYESLVQMRNLHNRWETIRAQQLNLRS